jgi:hypothetical protein
MMVFFGTVWTTPFFLPSTFRPFGLAETRIME